LIANEPATPVAIDIDGSISDSTLTTYYDANNNVVTNVSSAFKAVINPTGDNPYKITATAVQNSSAASFSVSNATLGVAGDTIQEQSSERLTLAFENTTGQAVTLSTLEISIQQLNHNESFDLVVTGLINNVVTSVTYSVGDATSVVADSNFPNTDRFTLDISQFDTLSDITISGDANTSTQDVLKVVDFDVNFSVSHQVGDWSYDFDVLRTDSDGSPATSSFTVDVYAGTAGNDNISTGSLNDTVSGGSGADLINTAGGDDIIFGGLGDDQLTGGAGSDTFGWRIGDTDGGTDIVTDFTTGAGGDVLDFSDLLESNNDYVLQAEYVSGHLKVSVVDGNTSANIQSVELTSVLDDGSTSAGDLLASLLVNNIDDGV